MKIIVTYLLFICALNSVKGQVQIPDTELKQCFLDNYPSFLSPVDSSLTISVANSYTGYLECTGYAITDIQVLDNFVNTTGLELEGIELSDVSPLSSMTNLFSIILLNSELGTSPDLKPLLNLGFFRANNCNLNTFPQFNDAIAGIDLSNNNLTEVNGLEGFKKLDQLQLNMNKIHKISGYENLNKLKLLFLGDNQLTSIPSIEKLDSLERLLLFSNQLTTIDGLENKPKLWDYNISNNHFSGLPIFGSVTRPSKVSIRYNYLTFEDILPLTSWSGFPSDFPYYNNQNYQGEKNTVTTNEGNSWSWDLNFDLDVTTNYYLWFKNGVQIDSTFAGSYIIDEITTEYAGVYTCQVRNTTLDTMIIENQPIVLEVMPFTSHPKPIVFSPDIDDKLYIQQTGEIRIFNESGQLITTLYGPTNWDGRSKEGKPVSLGYYVIITEEESFGVTVVR